MAIASGVAFPFSAGFVFVLERCEGFVALFICALQIHSGPERVPGGGGGDTVFELVVCS